MWLPSGDHCGLEPLLVNCRWLPPSVSTTQIPESSPPSAKAMRFPSGDQAGS